ncbi:hypothetical protein ACQCX2_12935 [Propionibacteriaceae bacterium Y1700]|uniref:hypothetical protein n=1 Tax=Microlunatus sp. Y1700 TaxID=3418487 RepID=UPI003DA70DEA
MAEQTAGRIAPDRSNPLLDLASSVTHLVGDTLRVWLHLFPQLTTIWLAGWLIFQASMWAANLIPLDHVFVALAVFSLGFVGTLGAIVLMLRMIGDQLGVWSLVHDDDVDTSMTHILAVTLLPFLGIYAAFDHVGERASQMATMALIQTGLISEQNIITALDPLKTPQRTLFVVGLLVALYVIRRALDLVHEKTGWRVLGIAATFIEAYFLVVLILSGQRLLNRAKTWLAERRFMEWFDQVGASLDGFFSLINIQWPAVVAWCGRFFAETLWPTFWHALTEPITWLAVAALVYGSKVLSVADLWRRGQPLAVQVPVPARLQRLQALRRNKAGSTGFRRLWLEFQEIFLGDIDDKYLPTLQSLRLILRAGATFLGAYVLVYTALRVVGLLTLTIFYKLVGGHDLTFWLPVEPVIRLAREIISEPLRICLLAVAFHRALLLFQRRAGDHVEQPDPDGHDAPGEDEQPAPRRAIEVAP